MNLNICDNGNNKHPALEHEYSLFSICSSWPLTNLFSHDALPFAGQTSQLNRLRLFHTGEQNTEHNTFAFFPPPLFPSSPRPLFPLSFSSMGYCILVAHGLGRLCSLVGRWGTTVLSVSMLLLLLLFSWKTVLQNHVWLSREALFR